MQFIERLLEQICLWCLEKPRFSFVKGHNQSFLYVSIVPNACDAIRGITNIGHNRSVEKKNNWRHWQI